MFCIIKDNAVVGFIQSIEQSTFLLEEDPSLLFLEAPAYNTEYPLISDFKLVNDEVVFHRVSLDAEPIRNVTAIVSTDEEQL